MFKNTRYQFLGLDVWLDVWVAAMGLVKDAGMELVRRDNKSVMMHGKEGGMMGCVYSHK